MSELHATALATAKTEHSMHDGIRISTNSYITFKTAVLAYKCQHGMAPLYLREYCQPLSSVVSRQRRSEHSGRLAVPQTRTNYGDRSFAVQKPRTWNSLPADLRAPDISVKTFRHKLKTFLFAV